MGCFQAYILFALFQISGAGKPVVLVSFHTEKKEDTVLITAAALLFGLSPL